MILSVTLVAASLPFTLGLEWLNARKVAATKDAEREELTREGDVEEGLDADMREGSTRSTEVGLMERPSNSQLKVD